jgi:hypothetical protein
MNTIKNKKKLKKKRNRISFKVVVAYLFFLITTKLPTACAVEE